MARVRRGKTKYLYKTIALEVIAALAAASVAGCGPGAGASPADTIIYAQGADPRSLDPAIADEGESSACNVNMYEGLTKFGDNTTDIKPCLAESWTISPDGLVYTFKLREGVKFHDGTTFDADAVKYNIERQMPPNDLSRFPYAAFTFGYVKSVEAAGEYSVKITLVQPYTPFLANLAMSQGAPMVSPAALKNSETGDVNENPCGTGPYRFVSWQRGVAVTMARNDDYWGAAALVKNLVIQITPDNATRAAQMMTGAIDGMNGLDPPNVAAVRAKGAQIFSAEGMNVSYMAFNVRRAPFNDPALREAVIRAVNVDELVSSLYQGYASPAYSILPAFMPGYNPDARPFAYDPERAKALLEREGRSGLRIRMITYSNPRPYNTATGTKLAAAVQSYLQKVGIEANIAQYDWTTYKTKFSQGEGDIAFYGWVGDNGDPDNFMNLLADQDPSINLAGYNNPEYKALIDEAAALPDGPDRDRLYQRMEDMIARDGVWLPISHARSLAAYSPRLTNFSVHPTGNIFFARIGKN